MLINEIEVKGSSITLAIAICTSDINAEQLFSLIEARGDMFDLETEVPGFHDTECDNDITRGFYSFVVPFEVEELIDGTTTKTLHKRIRSCEFISNGTKFFVFGNQVARKLMLCAASAITGLYIDLHKFEYVELSQLSERMSRIKTIVVTNPKEKELRRARLAGHMESYTEYNIVDPRNHGIDSVSGLLETPLGPLTLTAAKTGSLRFAVKRGLIMTFECLEWVIDLILGKHTGIKQAEQPELPFETTITENDVACEIPSGDRILHKVMDNLENPGPGMEKVVADFKKTVTKDGGSCEITLVGPGVEPRSVKLEPGEY